MKQYFLAGFLVFCLNSIAFSQNKNLIPNGDFEKVAAIPANAGQFYLARPWASTAQGQEPADLFHKRSRSVAVRAPLNYAGEQEPHSGEAYAGIAVLRGDKIDYREFMQVLLVEPLEKGVMYELELYASLSENSALATSSLACYLSQKAPLLIEKGYTMYNPQVQLADNNIITEKEKWVRISGQFKAAGGETIVTIGSFKTPETTPKIKIELPVTYPVRKKSLKEKVASIFEETEDNSYSYYYIDDISLVKVADKQPEIIAKIPEPVVEKKPVPVAKQSAYFGDLTTSKTIRLNNIFFQPDKAVLLPTSFPELDKLYGFLAENPTVSIQVNGHTDITHLPDYNQVLSENRATAVKNYLIRKGINHNRIKTKGFGETQPVATNETVEGKALNRRVEFEILP